MIGFFEPFELLKPIQLLNIPIPYRNHRLYFRTNNDLIDTANISS